MPVERPLVSIVTVVLNGAPEIDRAITSVLGQTYAPLEYIVVDGGSTDGTLAIIRRYEDRLGPWLSEPDRGISDAFNKGIRLARGRYVGLVNSDDWMSPDQVARLVETLEQTGADFAFGDLDYHAPDGRVVHRINGDPDYARHLPRIMPNVNHPTMLVRREVYQRVGGFSPDYHYAMDYDWLCRVHAEGFRGAYAPGAVGHMTLGGACDRHHLRARAEDRRIAVRHGLPVVQSWLLYGYRVVKGLGQRAVHRIAPEPAYHWLRRRINRSYEPYG
ncbi:MAG: glycosyltransferase family 2 protein [Geminicoccaceae bacterium]|nr:glycosyltransferase family 2 protein [Geminicoccaceae bacterium]